MRVFFGIDIEPHTTLAIADWRDRQLVCSGRPVPPANFHITLAFVGEMAEPGIERLCYSIDEWMSRGEVPGSTLSLDQTGYWHRPEIYWLGPTQWPEALTRLARKLGSLSSSLGGKRERGNFQPHITLYRRCDLPPPAPAQPPLFSLQYRHCTLFESRQGRRGVSYHPLQDWELAN